MKANQLELSRLKQEAADENTPGDRLKELAKLSTELARIVANNSSTPSELLEELANSSDATTRENLAMNPNTPTQVLLKLGADFPHQLLGNPVFSLLLLENPNLVSEMPLNTLRSVLKQEHVPVSFLEQAANKQDLEVHLAIVMNPKTPREGLVKEKLLQSKYPQVVEAVQLHVNWAGEMTEGWDEAAREAIQAIKPSYRGDVDYLLGDRDELIALAHLGFIPEFLILHWQKHWWRDWSNHVLSALAISVNTPPSVLAQLGKNKNPHIRSLVAQNLSTPVTTLEKLVDDEALGRDLDSIQASLLKNPNAPISVLEKLAKEHDFRLRCLVAEHPRTHAYLLEQLATDNVLEVRHAVANNPNTPSSINVLEKFAQDSNLRLRCFVAKQSTIPVYLLKQLAMDEAIEVHYAVAKNPNTPVSVLEKFAQDNDSHLRYCVAEHPEVPAYLLKQLAMDESAVVRCVVANNPNTPTPILEKMTTSEYVMPIRDAALHTLDLKKLNLTDVLDDLFQRVFIAIPSEGGMSLSERWIQSTNQPLSKQPTQNQRAYSTAQPSNTSVKDIEGYAKSNYPIVRLIVLLHPKAPASVLKEKSHSTVWLERYAAAQNPSTPIDTLNTLANDGNRVVRAAAKANLKERSQQL